MGGGKPTLTFIPTCAMVGIGTTITNAKSTVPKSNFFILLPPSCSRRTDGKTTHKRPLQEFTPLWKRVAEPEETQAEFESFTSSSFQYKPSSTRLQHRARLHKDIDYYSKDRSDGKQGRCSLSLEEEVLDPLLSPLVNRQMRIEVKSTT